MSMNEETARTIIRVREAENAHSIRSFSKGRGAKKKGPNCIQIRVLLCERATKRCISGGKNDQKYGIQYILFYASFFPLKA